MYKTHTCDEANFFEVFRPLSALSVEALYGYRWKAPLPLQVQHTVQCIDHKEDQGTWWDVIFFDIRREVTNHPTSAIDEGGFSTHL